ncbi:MAG: apolipoprotein A1/A4/E family protein [Synergistaceae bacterium]|jgi:DNA anti-recombination protein RmuC|nr:apolipoprotein A1/A4/E family protein [Synergistaceae bacterium]
MADIAAMHGTQRETISVLITPVDERRFESEIRRLDEAVSDEKKNREKFETRIEKAVNDLRVEMNVRFDKMEKSVDSRFDEMKKSVDSRFDKMEKSVDSRFDKMEKSVDSRFDKMEKSVDSRFDEMEKSVDSRFDKVDSRFDKMEKSVDLRFEKVDIEIGNLRGEVKRLDDRLWWILGAVILSILIPIAMRYM